MDQRQHLQTVEDAADFPAWRKGEVAALSEIADACDGRVVEISNAPAVFVGPENQRICGLVNFCYPYGDRGQQLPREYSLTLSHLTPDELLRAISWIKGHKQ